MKVLIVENDAIILNDIAMHIESLGFETIIANDGREALCILHKNAPDIIFTDFEMPHINGLQLLEEVKKTDKNIPVIVFTGYGSIDYCTAAMKAGAFDYLTKPFTYPDIENVLFAAIKKAETMSDSPPECNRADILEGVIYKSKCMQKVADQVFKTAKSDVNIMIYGESGTGKEQIARNIHRLSGRKSNAFVPLDCVAMPATLLESELFGFEKGAFTGALYKKPGVFELAEGGTVFFDEISELDIMFQAKLLRVLQERQFRRIGGLTSINVDVRIIAASNKNLKEAVENGQLREDLYYRLHVVPVYLPALRHRKEDIPLLVNHFIKKYSHFSPVEIDSVTDAAIETLAVYHWPGNVRELENTVQRVISLLNSPVIDVSDLPDEIKHGGKALRRNIDLDKPFSDIKKEFLGELGRQYCMQMLKKFDGNITKASQSAGVCRATFYKMLAGKT